MTAVAELPEKWREEAKKIGAHTTAPHGLTWDHGACDALNRCADELTAALASPAELGGVEDYVDPLDVFLSQGVDDVPCLQVPGRVLARFVPGSWDCAYEMFSGNTPTPRAAEAVTEEMVERMVIAFGREPNWSMLNVEAKRAKARRYLTTALTPPSAKGE